MRTKLLVYLIVSTCLLQVVCGQNSNKENTEVKKTEENPIDTVSYFSYYCSGKTSNCLIFKKNKLLTVEILDSANNSTNNYFNLEIDFSDNELNSWLNSVNKGCIEKNELLAYKIRQKISRFNDQEKREIDIMIIDSIASELDRDIYAGTLFNVTKTIPIYNKDSLAFLRTGAIKDTVFIINNIRAQIDYNKLYDITIDGTLVMKNKGGEETKLPLVITNGEYSISFLGLNSGWFILKLPVIQSHSLYINYANVLQYKPTKSEFAMIVRNQSLHITPEGNANVLKRSFSDYVSFRTFLDPLGFLSRSPNGFAQLEGDAIIPLKLTNRKRSIFLPQANFTFSYIYSNSINSEPRIAPVYQLKNTDTTSLGNDTLSRFNNNIDIIKYSYYQFNTKLSVYALELKQLSSWLHFELGARVAGAKVGDTINNRIIHKLIPEAQIRLEIRPDYVIGASIAFGIAILGNSPRGNNSPHNINDISFLYKSAFSFPHEVNIYAMTGNGKGGLFFRYSGWLASNEKLSSAIDKNSLPSNSTIKKTSYFPQILIGYSTNISTLIKRTGSDRVYR